jgi:hypothetical protein
MRDHYPVPAHSSASSKRIDSRAASNRRERRPAARTTPPRAARCRQKIDSPPIPPTTTMRRDHPSSVRSETSLDVSSSSVFGSYRHSSRSKAREMLPRAARCRQEIDLPPTHPVTTTTTRRRDRYHDNHLLSTNLISAGHQINGLIFQFHSSWFS